MLGAMATEADRSYAAVKSRDPRFDGRFFTAVNTTGIYCRPICPARTPLRKNVTFFACAAAAEEAGFRPCRRCRPESAPGTPSWLGASTTVSRALRLIERGTLDELGVDGLAAQLGIGDRYLRRLFEKHLGTSPQALAASRRAHSARMLLDSTAEPVTQVAHASGFGSVRQFNDVIRNVFGQTPTQLRGVKAAADPDTRLRLAFRPPFGWESLLKFLALRAIPGVERVADGVYRRTFANATGSHGVLEVRLTADARALELTLPQVGPAGLLDTVRRIRRLFDLDADPLAVSSQLKASGLALEAGLRIPGAWDTFETLVRAVLGQQVSVAAATTLSGRLVQRFGVPFSSGGLTHLFPTPAALAGSDLAPIGLPRVRAASLRALSAAVAKTPALLTPAASLEALLERLCALPGVGPWTANYVAMRAFNEPDAFPSGDLILRRAAGDLSAGQLEERSQAWRPWRAYAAIGLWASHSSKGAQ